MVKLLFCFSVCCFNFAPGIFVHTHANTQGLILILVKTKRYISSTHAWDVHQRVYEDYECFILKLTHYNNIPYSTFIKIL